MLTTPENFSPVSSDPVTGIGGRANALILRFRGTELLVSDSGDRSFAQTEDAADADTLVVGRWNGRLVIAVTSAADTLAPSGGRWAGLRSLFGIMSDDLVAIAGRATQLLEWDRTHKYCGVCATPTQRELHERARRCPACAHSAYPRISPAMMCLVTRGQEILLARNVNFPAGRFSALAGFLEAGESAEDAVHREVREEVGIEVSKPVYFASQSWPFPHSLMIAYTAEYLSGDLMPNGHEIAEADWFSADNLPQLPPRMSISRALIDHTLQKLRGN